MKKQIAVIAVLCGFTVFLGGCAKKTVKRNIRPIQLEMPDYQETQQEVTVKAKILTPEETQATFGENTIYQSSRKIEVIQLHFDNASEKTYVLDGAAIPLKCVLAQDVAKLLVINRAKGAVAANIVAISLLVGAGLFIAGPLLLAFSVTNSFDAALCMLAAYYVGIPATLGNLLVGGSVALYYSSDYCQKDPQEIKELEYMISKNRDYIPLIKSVDVFLFVERKNLQPFNVSLMEARNKQENIELNIPLLKDFNS